jgi:BirA family transcriptional regulator, biotin operon repressor / biotin---[acetyl-CoA-carboxylase] ligase
MSPTKTRNNDDWQLPGELAFEWHAQLDSTSSELMRRARAGQLTQPTLIAAAQQSAGRGRMGRPWVGAAGDSLMFSLAYAVPASLPLAGLSLAVGVCVAEALNAALQAPQVLLKWPNDLLMAGAPHSSLRKLGGLLIESLPFNRNRNGALVAERWLVLGLGVNLRLSADHPMQAQAASLSSVWPHAQAIALPHIGSLCATACYQAIRDFERQGFAPFHARWHALHAHQGLRVRYTPVQGAVVEGIATGVDSAGQLMIESDIADNAGMQTNTKHPIASTEGQLRLC